MATGGPGLTAAGRAWPVPLAAISAHRGGSENAPAQTYEAYQHAVQTGAEYIEFDIRRTADGRLVVHHDRVTAGGTPVAETGYAALCEQVGYEVPLVAEVMRMIAGKALGHLDLKETGGESVIIELAREILGPGRFLATTLEDASVAAIKRSFPDVPVALTLGRDLSGARWPARLAARRRELFPVRRIRACGADMAAVHQRLAVAGVLGQCGRRGIGAMVWTANTDTMLARWLTDPRVDVVVTDRPARAVELRARILAPRGPGNGPPGSD